MHGVILQSPLIIMDQIIYDNFIRSRPILARECIRKSLLQKKTKGDIMKKQNVQLILGNL